MPTAHTLLAAFCLGLSYWLALSYVLGELTRQMDAQGHFAVDQVTRAANDGFAIGLSLAAMGNLERVLGLILAKYSQSDDSLPLTGGAVYDITGHRLFFQGTTPPTTVPQSTTDDSGRWRLEFDDRVALGQVLRNGFGQPAGHAVLFYDNAPLTRQRRHLAAALAAAALVAFGLYGLLFRWLTPPGRRRGGKATRQRVSVAP
ncbi:MAG: hypothetical protein ACFCBW_12425 [Candidatus Competibacterales bacterium]